MADWLLLIGYVCGYVATWRTVVWAVMEGDKYPPDGADIVMGVVFGAIANIAWPLIFVGMTVKRAYAWRFGEDTAWVMPRAVRRRRELDKRERHIAAMERELGIK